MQEFYHLPQYITAILSVSLKQFKLNYNTILLIYL